LAALLAPATASARGGVGASDHTVELLLELRHPAGLDRFVRAVSNPASPRYRHYATLQSLARRFGASPPHRKAAMRWLAARGLHGTVGPSGTSLPAPVSSKRASRLLPRPSGATASSASGLERAVPAGLRGAVGSVEILGSRPHAFKNVASISRAGPPR